MINLRESSRHVTTAHARATISAIPTVAGIIRFCLRKSPLMKSGTIPAAMAASMSASTPIGSGISRYRGLFIFEQGGDRRLRRGQWVFHTSSNSTSSCNYSCKGSTRPRLLLPVFQPCSIDRSTLAANPNLFLHRSLARIGLCCIPATGYLQVNHVLADARGPRRSAAQAICLGITPSLILFEFGDSQLLSRHNHVPMPVSFSNTFQLSLA